ncbi:hypothetical protein GBN33_13665 [Plesiomonas shigelloides]|uniref:hypothetical protein n=1 Tax=Plesiomonas shigelloides TaxID=703 RepID=UPI00126231D6|nr:hypothetical protein [Plesiomonas shigelloides]KAB7696318.1 hypothetical protein GBN33_13665 [Plesiomonas shigelloides]
MSEQAMTLIVFFNLKPDISEIDYLTWAKEVDLHTVNQLNSVTSFNIFKGLKILGKQNTSPWDYFEVIRIKSEKQFLQDIQHEEMQKVICQFEGFAANANFICTQDITSL